MKSGFTKTKIINDPVYGFIKIPSDLVYDLINHPVFQRLRRIKQLGLTYYVYPGAMHTRFQHAIGATHLMDQAIQNLRLKGISITDEESEAALIAILLHDIGHGPFSHALEETIIEGISHEDLSAILMQKLNNEFNGRLGLALEIFNNKYKKRFLHQLISGQLDMDRLDYLRRDSFFTGVTEGIIGSERIIKMLQVIDDDLVVEAKGIYSIEKFLIARRLMYWQVYFHKTVLAAEFLLVKLLKRAKELVDTGINVYASPPLNYFLKKDICKKELLKKEETIQNYIMLDDDDIMVSAKTWLNHSDKTLSYLSKSLVNRILPKIKVQKQPFDESAVFEIKKKIGQVFQIPDENINYLVFTETITTGAYTEADDKIKIVYNDGYIEDLVKASDIFNMDVLLKAEKKYFLSYPKNCGV